MSRILSVILIPALLITQSLLLIPHSHAGNMPFDHAARPHFHLHGSAHHGDSHHSHDATDSPSSSPDSDHDSDAVYAADMLLMKDGTTASRLESRLFVSWRTGSQVQVADSFGLPSNTLQNASSRPLCALYLQTLSIRC